MPDLIISALSMPNMNGFEFLSVVRRLFPVIPVIEISGEFSGLSVPESVLADAFFAKCQYQADKLFEKIAALTQEIPQRPRTGKLDNVAIWVKNDKGLIAVTCTDCLRTFPVSATVSGINTVQRDFCLSPIKFEIINAD